MGNLGNWIIAAFRTFFFTCIAQGSLIFLGRHDIRPQVWVADVLDHPNISADAVSWILAGIAGVVATVIWEAVKRNKTAVPTPPSPPFTAQIVHNDYSINTVNINYAHPAPSKDEAFIDVDSSLNVRAAQNVASVSESTATSYTLTFTEDFKSATYSVRSLDDTPRIKSLKKAPGSLSIEFEEPPKHIALKIEEK